ncbi:MAG: hypothetical protein WC750_03295 [Patescibacteria group bacterium]|jgi:hypothetical protein
MKFGQIVLALAFLIIGVWFFGGSWLVETYTWVADSSRSWF